MQTIAHETIVSTQQKTSFYNPPATNLTVRYADLFMLRDLMERDNLRLCRTAWLGSIGDVSHRFVMQHKAPNGDIELLFPLHHFKDSGLLCFDVKETVVGNDTMFEFVIGQSPKIIALVNLGKLAPLACDVKVRSWAWQWFHKPELITTKPMIRIFKQGDLIPVVKLCADAGGGA